MAPTHTIWEMMAGRVGGPRKGQRWNIPVGVEDAFYTLTSVAEA